jgi:hypothetical protein
LKEGGNSPVLPIAEKRRAKKGIKWWEYFLYSSRGIPSIPAAVPGLEVFIA